MARNRVIYQSEGVYVSQDVNVTGVATGDYDAASLYGIQNANYSFSIARQDVNCFGQLASVDRIITDTPTVSFDTSYYLANFGNEKKLGFHIWAGPNSSASATPVTCISGLINSETNHGVKNYYILTTTEGADLVNNFQSGNYESIIGIGNASITSYSTEGAVGGMPTASVSAEGLNMNMVNLPYTGAYAGITGVGAANEGPLWTTDLWNGAGFQNAGAPIITITGLAGQAAYDGTDGAIQTIQIQSGNAHAEGSSPTKISSLYNRTGIGVSLPAGAEFKGGNPAGNQALKLILEEGCEKGDREIYAKLVKPVTTAKNFTSGIAFTGTYFWAGDRPRGFENIVSYISGSCPGIESADGELPVWHPQGGYPVSGAHPTTTTAPAPIKLPVAPPSLTSTGSNVSGSISVLRPGDITLTLKKKSDGENPDIAGIIINSAPIQSYSISFDMARTPLQKLGTKFAYARPVDFPVTSSFSFDAIVTDLTTGDVSQIIDCDDEYNATVMLKNKNCGKNEYIMAYEVKGLKVDDQSYSTSLGDNKSVSYSFSSQMGGPDQPDMGIFMSGYATENAKPFTPDSVGTA